MLDASNSSSDMDMKSEIHMRFPCTAARSTGKECCPPLVVILAAGVVNEVTVAGGWDEFKWQLASKGRANMDGKITLGFIFWFCPTGLYGPYHDPEERDVESHSLLFTVEYGVHVSNVVQMVKGASSMSMSSLVHVHIVAS